jgi:hypothetical protein
MPPVPAYSDALSYFPAENARAYGVNHAGNFVPWNARVRDAWSRAFFSVFVTMANAASLHFDADKTRSRLRDFVFHQLKWPLGVRNLNGAHLGHESSGVI